MVFELTFIRGMSHERLCQTLKVVLIDYYDAESISDIQTTLTRRNHDVASLGKGTHDGHNIDIEQ